MKKILIVLGALALVAVSATAAQKNVSQQDIAHPRLLEGVLDSNFTELYSADANLLTNAVAATRLTGNVAAAALSNAFTATIQPAYGSGKFSVVGTTQLVFIAGTVTNVIDSDITSP